MFEWITDNAISKTWFDYFPTPLDVLVSSLHPKPHPRRMVETQGAPLPKLCASFLCICHVCFRSTKLHCVLSSNPLGSNAKRCVLPLAERRWQGAERCAAQVPHGAAYLSHQLWARLFCLFGIKKDALIKKSMELKLG